jgi:hypothetical protein
LERVERTLRKRSADATDVQIHGPKRVHFQRVTMTGELGVVVWVPEWDEYFYSSSGLPSWIVALGTGIEERDTFISPTEALVAACAYFTFPDLLRSRLVHHFVDNDAAKAGLIKGTSSSPHTSVVLLEYHVVMVELQCDPCGWASCTPAITSPTHPPAIARRLCTHAAIGREV